MNKTKLKPWLLGFLLSTVALVFIGAWAKTAHRDYADTLLGAGLAGIALTIILFTAIFGAKNRPSNWIK